MNDPLDSVEYVIDQLRIILDLNKPRDERKPSFRGSVAYAKYLYSIIYFAAIQEDRNDIPPIRKLND